MERCAILCHFAALFQLRYFPLPNIYNNPSQVYAAAVNVRIKYAAGDGFLAHYFSFSISAIAYL